jgi:hypothetical protein
MASRKDVTFEEKKFTRDDIKPGYVVQLRNGEFRMAMPVGSSGTQILTNELGGRWNYLSSWGKDLCKEALMVGDKYMREMCKEEAKQCDIMKVFGYVIGMTNYGRVGELSGDHRPLLWERVEAKKMTVAEIEKELGYSVEIVAEK